MCKISFSEILKLLKFSFFFLELHVMGKISFSEM